MAGGRAVSNVRTNIAKGLNQMDWILDETQLVVSATGDVSSGTVNVSSSAL